MVLQPGASRPDSPYKRKNVRDGPIRMNPSVTHQQQSPSNSAAASSSHTSGFNKQSSSDTEDSPHDTSKTNGILYFSSSLVVAYMFF